MCFVFVPFRDGFCETGRVDYKPRCSDGRLYLSSLFLSYFLLSLFHLQLWCEFHFLLSLFSVFSAVVAGREGQITNPDAQIGDCILPHFPFLIFNFPFFIFNFGMNFIFYFHFLLFLAWLLQGGKGRLQTQMLRLELIIIPSPH